MSSKYIPSLMTNTVSTIPAAIAVNRQTREPPLALQTLHIQLPRRTLRSGKEFSAFDLALGRAIMPAPDFDVGRVLQQRLAEEETNGLCDEHEDTEEIPLILSPPSVAPPPPPLPLDSPTHAAAPYPLSAKERKQAKARRRRDQKRDEARATSSNPVLKSINTKRIAAAKNSALQLDIDTAALPHSKPAWIGSRTEEDPTTHPADPCPPHGLSSGLGTTSYTQEQVDKLSGTKGFMYIDWLGEATIPILDSQRRVIAVLGGMPRDRVGWKEVTDGAADMMQQRESRIRLTEERLHHRRAQQAFPAIGRGWSHGGGQTEPGELCNNLANTQVTDELMAHDYFKRIARFANSKFVTAAQMLLLAGWKPMRRTFIGSVFAACTFNFGPHAICARHLDFANLAWGWCAITALGCFDADLGGHLILWELRLVVRFPAGATILLPSALVQHSNIPIRTHEYRASFTQYTAGGLFRWVRNAFRTDEDYQASSTAAEKATRKIDDRGRWELGMKMFSVIDTM
ncbi:hypothetical protein B0H15DRAFT_957558 [Mycena belliarum]|uniref:Uncharacterized protein n=1 Tax=Mycena belliarum TaxID=1033014 RepID=A0AAD6TM59_9AGAR|nr:hypothetical protein B0H15DRAFT_957558 [Mycena belliae]